MIYFLRLLVYIDVKICIYSGKYMDSRTKAKVVLFVIIVSSCVGMIGIGWKIMIYKSFACMIHSLSISECLYNNETEFYIVLLNAIVNVSSTNFLNTNIKCDSLMSCDDCVDRYRVGSVHKCFENFHGVTVNIPTKDYTLVITGVSILFGYLIFSIIVEKLSNRRTSYEMVIDIYSDD